ncbi:MAG: NAD(P)-binding protein, partial [Geodermatophilaceae bacterium]|nr:NAD(P)-binding protein [Geodermatophilaceae bacterium]
MTTDTTAGATARPTAAVVGSGVAGLTSAYLLQRRYDVTLFEADDRTGGHAHTHDIPTADSRVIPVDTGFIVHNERTYPNLLRLFAELGVATQGTEMSMSIKCEGCGLEYAGARGLNGVFAQRQRLADPKFVRMLLEVKSFHRHAHRLLAADPDVTDSITLGAFLAIGGYSDYFIRHFMIPVVSCVWSSGTELSMQYPA